MEEKPAEPVGIFSVSPQRENRLLCDDGDKVNLVVISEKLGLGKEKKEGVEEERGGKGRKGGRRKGEGKMGEGRGKGKGK